jgi:transposase-like protein
VAEAIPSEEIFDVECPHCHRRFRSKLLVAQTARHEGFKCPHCKLFVAYERTGDANETAP